MAKAVPVKINWSEHRQKFADLLNKFSAYGYSRFNVFSDFCELSAISIADNCDPYHLVNSEKTVDEREERYKNLIGKYKPEAQNLFGDILAAIVQEMQTYCPNHFIDVLGEIYHSLEFQDKWRGQFFTPQSVCDTMGRMAMLDGTTVKERIAEKGYVSLNEPCCGGGAIILGAANALTYHGLNPQKQMLTVANADCRDRPRRPLRTHVLHSVKPLRLARDCPATRFIDL